MLAIFWPEEQDDAPDVNIAAEVSFSELMDTDWRKGLAVLREALDLPLATRDLIAKLENEVQELEADGQRERQRHNEEAKAMVELVKKLQEDLETDRRRRNDQTREFKHELHVQAQTTLEIQRMQEGNR